MTGGFQMLSEPAEETMARPVKSGEDVSAAALIYDRNNNALLQLREDLPKVAFGGYWGLFGGRVESGETPLIGLARELEEELSIRLEITPKLFSSVAWNGGGIGDIVRTRHYFLVPISPLLIVNFKLGEGADIAIASVNDVPDNFNVMPHDHLALSMFWRTAYST
jgi:8-oxo-dGTP diphosphatase